MRRIKPGENFHNRGNIYSDDDLFRSIEEVEKLLGREPKKGEYNSNGAYSYQPFIKRFVTWDEAIAFYRKWKSDQGTDFVLAPVESGSVTIEGKKDMSKSPLLNNISISRTVNNPAQLYGEPIDFRGLRHAPINEQGVVYLFGMVSRELGFYIEAIQQGLPDCEGKYLHDKKKNLWAKARIEFEFKASNFQEHGHDLNQCDFIVCWINDWPDCPITIIELKHEILKLPQG